MHLQLPEETERNITVFYSYVNNLIKNRQSADCGTGLHVSHRKTVISIRGTDLSFRCAIQGLLQPLALPIPLPDKNISLIGHEIINRLHIRSFGGTRTIPMAIFDFFYQELHTYSQIGD